LGLLLLCGSGLAQFRAPAAPFRQDRFAIGMWVPPQSRGDLAFRYQEIAEANFNLVIGNSPLPVADQLQLCDQLGLRALVAAPGPVASWPTNTSCWGYLLQDEPSAAAFPELAQTAAEIRRVHPGRFGYINLFPNYANAAQLGVPTYEEHVAQFMAQVKPEVLSMDHYPRMRPDGDSRAAYCENLETFRRHSLAAGVPFWNFFYALPFADRIDPTEAQIRWQIYTALAYGAKGVLYFCYWTPGQGNGGTGEFPKGGALLTAEGRRTRHYGEAKRINAELLQLGPTLLQLTSEGVRRIGLDSAPAVAPSPAPIRQLERVRNDPRAEFIAGSFRHADGRRAALLVNHDYAYTAWPTVTFDADPTQVREVDKATGAESVVVDDSPELPGLQLSFGPGDGRLFLLPAAK
jgi:hypothetical protein